MNVATATRKVAIDAVNRIDDGGAYANIVLPNMLRHTPLNQRDRGFVTELVYGTTRMRRSCDWLVDRFLMHPVEPIVRAALRVGAYQLGFLQTPAHAAVHTTVSASPARARKLINAVLRRVAAEPLPRVWPDRATELSYPDWIVEQLIADLGEVEALAALAKMNEAPPVTTREDGYVQDRSSQAVVELIGRSDLLADVCAAPGGKATGMAASAGFVVASDVRTSRVGLLLGNRRRLDSANLSVVQADARNLPYPDGRFDAVLVDAPCSGLGALRRRPDARWRIEPDDVARLAALQIGMLREASRIVRPGGTVVYSVCTLTEAETVGVDAQVPASLDPLPLPEPWRVRGRGGVILPQDADGDGMFAVRYRKRG